MNNWLHGGMVQQISQNSVKGYVMSQDKLTPHKYADVLRAIADGHTVQSYSIFGSGRWQDVRASDVFSLTEWRIKPKPKVKKWQWVYKNIVNNKMNVSVMFYASEEDFKQANPSNEAIQKIDSTMIEVEE